MTTPANLLATIPCPQQHTQQKVDAQPIASVKVSDVVSSEPKTSYTNDSGNFITNFFENLKQKLIEKRIKKLESIPPEQRTPVQQAEIEANQKALNIKV